MRRTLPLLSIFAVVFCACRSTSTTLALPAADPVISKPNCPSKCGNIIIPYPFGIGSECSANSSFLIICQNSTDPPKPFLPSINMEVIDINGELFNQTFLDVITITVKTPVAPMKCTNGQETVSTGISFLGSPYAISASANSFAILGCKNNVSLPSTAAVLSGCTPDCNSIYDAGYCNIGTWCTTNIPPLVKELNYSYQSIEHGNNNGSCGYAFPVANSWFSEGYLWYKGLQIHPWSPFDENLVDVPLVLDWKIDRELLPNTSFNADCENANGTGRCSCSHGFYGYPYIDGGCVDIDECRDPSYYACSSGGICVNEIGSYKCLDLYPNPKAAANQGHGTRLRDIILISRGGILCAGILILTLIGAWRSIKIIAKRFDSRRRRRLFTRNGGLLLEQKLSSTENGYKKSKLFTSKELTQATDHYNENRILGHGGQGTVYKGMLTDGRIVAVKKSRKVHEDDIEVFINEVLILSQINHRNIVKLLGCCLETEIPLLVYEFIPNGTLFQHIHDPVEDFPLTWEMRLRIAVDIAGAISYLHSSASAPIFHRDIKSTNVLLDERYRAKISDFGTSRSVAVDQTHFTTRVMGTFGYLDPEYFQSNRFTEKSDVYSFGVVMVELLTGERAISSLRDETGRSLAAYFLHSMDEDKVFDIIDARILEQGQREEIATVAEICKRCLHLNGKLRPTMKQVANELESIQMKKSSSGLELNHDLEASDSVETIESCDCSSALSLTLER